MRRAGVGLVVLGVAVLLLPQSALARPGDLYPKFSRDGKDLSSRAWGSGVGVDVAPLGDGGVLVLGNRFPNPQDGPGPDTGAFVSAYRANGKLDRSFGLHGTVSGVLGPGGGARNIEVGPDGKIVVAGQGSVSGTDAAPALAQLNPDGSFDQTFGGDGTVVTDPGPGGIGLGFSGDAAVDASGRIVVGGATDAYGAFIARYLPDGTLDPSFDNDGIATLAPGPRAVFRSVALLPDGKVLAVGEAGGIEVVLARFTPEGQPDPTFSDDGIATFESVGFPGRTIRRLALAPDGSPWVAGMAGTGNLKPSNISILYHFDPVGSLDASFSADGWTYVPDSFDVGFDTGLAIQANGLPLVATSAGRDFLVTRFGPAGELDPAFSGDGSVTTDFQRLDDFATGAAISDDGSRLFAVGIARSKKGSRVALAVYELFDGPADADGDGVRDKRDRCPRLWSAKSNGCPKDRR